MNEGPASFRKQMKEDIIQCAGVFNGISALIAQSQGFSAIYLSGSSVAACMGLPDLSLTTLTEVAAETRKIASIARVPLVVDVDTGFGETGNTIRTMVEMEHAGASAIHIEDQVLPKRCGHLPGKEIIRQEDMVRKIRAAVSARKNPDFVIIARTDSFAVEGFQDAVDRANSYLEAGADMIFPEALDSPEAFRDFKKQVGGPLMANMTEFGKSPLLSSSELQEMGYSMVLFPLTGFRASLLNLKNVYHSLKDYGTQRDMLSSLMTRGEFYDLIGYSEYEKEDQDIFDGKRV
ncbi:MAG: methylisocitrate lyase [Candidatus Thermoplasmatota archaeon]|nr:methylisocitrate lyase [Candidatus Thermoplasmatota archaeon]MCL5438063.1 methylisocitrate lyase [Candidatus Thermoplasmatota archaeon]